MINLAAWTARFTYFVAFTGAAFIFFIGWTLDSSFVERFFGVGSGYIWALLFWFLFCFMGFATIQILKNSSPKFMSDTVWSTLSSTAKLKPTPELRVGTGENTRVSHPSFDVYALGGGGPLSGVSIHCDGNFALVRRGLSIEVQRNVFANAYMHPYYPIDFAKMALESGLVTSPLDDRTKLPAELLEYLRPLKGFGDRSVIYVGEVPIFPMYVSSPDGSWELDVPDPKIGRIKLKNIATPQRILFDFASKAFFLQLSNEMKARDERAQQQLALVRAEAAGYVESIVRQRNAMADDRYDYEPASLSDRMRGPIQPPPQQG